MGRRADLVIPVFGDADVTRQCLESVLRHTSPELGQLIVIDDCSPEPRMQSTLEWLRGEHPEVVLIRNEANLGFVRSANRGIGLRQRDVVLLNSDTLVTAGWLSEMLEVAYSSERIACVVPLSNNGAFCSVPEYCEATDWRELLGKELQLDQLPRSTLLPTAVGFCLLMKNTVLNMIGAFDPAFGRGYHEENDWCLRAQTLGLDAVRANRAMVYHLGSVSFGSEKSELDRKNGELLVRRYPYFPSCVNAFSRTAEARVAAYHAKHRLGSLAAILSRDPSTAEGPDEEVQEAQDLARALRRHTAVRVSTRGFSEEGAVVEQPKATDLKPDSSNEWQVFHHLGGMCPGGLDPILDSTAHVVISNLDLTAWRTPSAHESFDEFERYRAACFVASRCAQAIIAPSDHGKREIISDFRVAADRVHTVYPGFDSSPFERRNRAANRIQLANQRIQGPYFLYSGPDDAPQNLKLLLAGYALFRHRFQGSEEIPGLVLIGQPSRALGSLFGQDKEGWPPGVCYLGALRVSARAIFLQEALALVYPSAHESFARVLLEAMAAGTPILCSRRAALPEIAGEAAVYIKDFTPQEISLLLLRMATSSSVRENLVAAGRARVQAFSWKETALRTAEVYQEVVGRPDEGSLFEHRMFSTLWRSFQSSPRSSIGNAIKLR